MPLLVVPSVAKSFGTQDEPIKCIPFVTGGSGWNLDARVQQLKRCFFKSKWEKEVRSLHPIANENSPKEVCSNQWFYGSSFLFTSIFRLAFRKDGGSQAENEGCHKHLPPGSILNLFDICIHQAPEEETMQKATGWNMPLAPVVAHDWSTFTKLPLSVRSVFYWWVLWHRWQQRSFLDVWMFDQLLPREVILLPSYPNHTCNLLRAWLGHLRNRQTLRSSRSDAPVWNVIVIVFFPISSSWLVCGLSAVGAWWPASAN